MMTFQKQKMYREEKQADQSRKTTSNPSMLTMPPDMSDPISDTTAASSPPTRGKTTPSNALE